VNPLLILWRASVRSSANTLRFDARMRLGALCGLLFQLGLGLWALSRLIPTFAQWQSAGENVLTAHLWLTCLLAWPAIALFAGVATLMYGLGSDEALLLATQPIEPATLLRALYGMVLWRGIGNWLAFEAGLIGLALLLSLGWSALPWLLLLVLGALFVAWLSLLGTLLVTRYMLPPSPRALLWGLIPAAGAGLLLLLARTTPGSAFIKSLPLLNVAAPLTCVLICGGLALILLLAWFPLARRLGLLYLATLQQQQGRARSVRSLSWPGLRSMLALLSRLRTPTGALLVKGLLQQSRHLFTWARLLVLIALLALFTPLRPQLAALRLDDTLQVALYAACMAFLALIEYVPYAISGEGARLALYLVAPFDLAVYVRARLLSFLCPALLTGWLSAIFLGIEIHLNVFSLLASLALTSLLLSGYVAFTVLGSALDADLAQIAEDSMQALILEEFPGTPRRLQLLGLTILLFGGMLALCWKLPLLAALLALAALDAGLLLVGWRVSKAYLARLEG
jgi:hypothetical protein